MKKQKLHFSRLLSLALSLALLCTALSVPFSVSAAGNGVNSGTSANPWDGDVAEEADLQLRTEGANSAANPYIIDCAEKLAYIARAGSTATNGKYYELTCDIYLNNVTDDNWHENEGNTPWFDSTVTSGIRFDGHLNGNGKKIYGLYINDSNRSNAGLFMLTKGDASVSNLGIENSYINAKSNVGAIFGSKDNFSSLTLSNCYSSDTVILTASGNNAGGLIGYLNIQGGSAYKNIFKNCYSSAQVAAAKDAYSRNTHGGLFGQTYAGGNINISITNCYSTQSGTTLLGCLPNTALLKSSGTFKNNYSTGWSGNWAGSGSAENMAFSNNKFKNGTGSSVSVAGMTGELAYENMPGYDFNSVWHVFDGGTPKLRVFDFPGKNLDPEIWDGETVATSFAGGTGTSTDPYRISNGAQLAYFVQKGIYGFTGTSDKDANGNTKEDGSKFNYTNVFDDSSVFATAGKYFKLTNDIYLNNVSTDWYSSDYEGDRSTLGLHTWNNAPTLSFTKKFENNTSTTGTTKPAFSGTLDGAGHRIYGLYTDGIARAGLLYDCNAFTIKNLGIEKSYIRGLDTGTNCAGAFTSQNTWGGANYTNCYVSDTVTVMAVKAGGFEGYSGGTNNLTDCYSSAKVFTTGSNENYLGAFIGQILPANTNNKFTRCFSTQSDNNFVGHDSTVAYNYTNCYAVKALLKKDPNDESKYVQVITDDTKFKQINAEQMLGDGMENLVNAKDNAGKNVWATNPKSTPTLAVFPIDGDVNGDKSLDICDLVLAKQVSLNLARFDEINLATTNLDNEDGLYTINEADINRIRAGKLLGLDF